MKKLHQRKTIGDSEKTIQYILKKKECTGELSNIKPERSYDNKSGGSQNPFLDEH